MPKFNHSTYCSCLQHVYTVVEGSGWTTVLANNAAEHRSIHLEVDKTGIHTRVVKI